MRACTERHAINRSRTTLKCVGTSRKQIPETVPPSKYFDAAAAAYDCVTELERKMAGWEKQVAMAGV